MKEKKHLIDYKNLIEEWDWLKNKDLNPNNLLASSGKKAWWKCKKGHEWESTIYSRKNGTSCPYCANKKILVGYNDLFSTNPELEQHWDYKKNNELGIFPQNVSYGSGKKVWWICPLGHSYIQPIFKKISEKSNCPICSKELKISFPEKVIYYYIKSIFDDALENYRPIFLDGKEIDVFIPSIKIGVEYDGEYWHKDANKDNKKNILCSENNINLIRIREPNTSKNINDVSINYILDDCREESLAKSIYFVINYINKLLNSNYKIDINIDRDRSNIYEFMNLSLKSNSLEALHPEVLKYWDYEKNKNIAPNQISYGSGKKVWWKCDLNHSYQKSVSKAVVGIGCPYCSNQKILQGYNDLCSLNPELIKEWNYEKNKIEPNTIGAGSRIKVWWRCKKGHEWETSVINRTNGTGCPYCSGNKISVGFNDFKTLYPELLSEWDYKKNSLNPEKITPMSNVKVWWRCKKGHSYSSYIYNKIKNKDYCPICNNKTILSGYNDLCSTYPRLAEEWNYEKNKIEPNTIGAGSRIKVWWKCKKGHEWEANIVDRKNGNNCPYCSGKYPIDGENDLATLYPDLVKEWNYEKNNPIVPNSILPKTNKKYWWKCKKGHEWEATPNLRTRGSNCPYCSGKYPIDGENDLATLYPALAKEWNYEKNGELTPINFLPFSEKLVWWKCSKCNFEWEAKIKNRSKGQKCPNCFKK